MTVTSPRKTLVWSSLLAFGAVLLGVGVWFAVTRLDAADKWGSVIGSLVAVGGLPMTIYAIVLARRANTIASTPPGPAAGGQSVTDSTIGGTVTQIRGVRGNVRIGPATPVAAPPPSSATAPPSANASPASDGGGQSVTRSSTAGALRQVDDVGGNVELDP